MKILYVASDQVVPGRTGGSVHVLEVARGLAARGHEVDAVVDADSQAADEPRVRWHPVRWTPHVRFFRGDGTPVGPGFYAYDAAFHGGITVAAGDIAGDGHPEIVTGPRGGGGPHVRVLMVDGTPVGPGFYAYDAAFGGGVAVAVGEAIPGGRDEIVTVPFADAPAHVRVFMSLTGDANGVGFYAFQPTPSGARVAVVRD